MQRQGAYVLRKGEGRLTDALPRRNADIPLQADRDDRALVLPMSAMSKKEEGTKGQPSEVEKRENDRENAKTVSGRHGRELVKDGNEPCTYRRLLCRV
jgi:hypothetical protein